MGDSIPYLGSKITLISKSEIRYEGILYTIDPHDSIIALARVQSFGTEDRQTDMPIAAKNDIYEYIIFRGTDIKKIEVCDTPKQLPVLHNDPAIVGLQVQQHSAPSVPTSYPGASFNPQSLGPIGSFYSSYGQQLGQQNLPSSGFSVGTSQPSELSSGIGSSVGVVSVEQPSPSGGSQPLPAPIGAPSHSGVSSHSHQQDVLAGGSRSSTPGLSRKSPVADAGVQVSPPPQQQNEKRRSNQSNQRPQHTPERQIRDHQGNQARRGQGNYYQQGGQNQYQSSRNNQGYQGYQGHQGYQEHRGYYQGQQQQQQQQQQQYWGGMGRSRPARRPSQPRGRGIFNQGNRQRQDQQLFEKEFDFEQANEEFEELRTQLAKTKITENGEKKDEKKEDSGHETATTGDDSEDSSSSVYYDKTSSFFDRISCDALERSKGRSQRSDWRQERKINIQTFGVATARRGYYPRGGRGGYYNRGGYYRNYNQGYYRGNNSNYRGYRGGMGGGNSNHLSNSNNSNRMTTVNGSVGAGDTGGAINSSSSSSTYASAVRSTTAVAK